jgi:PAS domain S-box-containing protein
MHDIEKGFGLPFGTQEVGGDGGRYRRLVDAVTDYAIYMLDPQGVVVSWNAGAQRFKGYTPEEIIGQHFSRFYTEEDRATNLPARALKIAAEEGKFEQEGWRVRRDGSRFWAHVVIDPIRDPDGKLTGYAKVTRDLTERRHAEKTLRQSQEQFRLLVQGVTDYAIYMLNPEGIVTSWNAGAQRIKGYQAHEIVGQHFSRFYPAEDRLRGDPQKALDTARREGRFEKEGWRVRKDGTRFWSHVILDPIRDDDGDVIGFAKITRDITERRAAQHDLEIAREALFQSQKMDAVGQLTGGVAHDFNNLLMAVLGSLELLRKRMPQDAALLRLLDNAVEGAQRGASLTQRMLAFARRQELDKAPVDVVALVRGMAELLQRSVGGGVIVEMQFPLSVGKALADVNQLELALLNLTVNARDAMPDGGTIWIGASEETVGKGHDSALPEGRYVCLSLTDKGVGMDAQTLARATEPFFTTKGVGKGTGLGLPMVHGMSEQMGGRFVLKSKVGEGTRAEIWLPVAEEDTRKASPPETAAAEPPVHKPLRVLAVDDDVLVLFNTVSMLEDMGHTVLQAGSGAEALALLRVEKVDLIITDQAMPLMTGAQLIEIARKDYPALAAVLATGYAELPGGTHVDALRLTKPFTQKQLADVVAQVDRKGGD